MEMKTLYAIFQIKGANVEVVQTGYRSWHEAEQIILTKTVGEGYFIQAYYGYA